MNISTFREFTAALPRDIRGIMDALESYGFETRVVGGAVRDLAMGKRPRDIDVATDALPDEVAYVLHSKRDELGIDAVDPKGIRHGTMVASTDGGGQYEITSLAFRIKERGGRLVTSRHRDWKTDALRRDFTMNAMSLSPDGTLYDYLGGLRDIANQRVKFVGFYKIRFVLEPVMVLRFAKALTRFPEPKYNPAAVAFIRSRPGLLDGIGGEALDWFLGEIRRSDYPGNADPVLEAAGIAPPVR